MNDLERMLSDIRAEVEYTRRYIGKDALDARVMQAMKQVPRHEFLPEDRRDMAYYNSPQPIGYGQTISQPYIVALMTDLLATRPDHVVLEVGTGSGYQSAVLSQLVKQVYSLEIVESLAKRAAKTLAGLGYANVAVRHGNGYHGWAEHAPYDGIIVTAAAPHIPQALLDQLKVGARLIIPVGLPYFYQELMLLEKKANRSVETTSVLGVSFVPLTGVQTQPAD